MDIGLVEGSEVGGTNPILESLEPVAWATDCACVEEEGGFEMTHKFIRWDSKGLCSIPIPLCWEGGVRLCVDSPCMCVCVVETTMGTLE